MNWLSGSREARWGLLISCLVHGGMLLLALTVVLSSPSRPQSISLDFGIQPGLAQRDQEAAPTPRPRQKPRPRAKPRTTPPAVVPTPPKPAALAPGEAHESPHPERLSPEEDPSHDQQPPAPLAKPAAALAAAEPELPGETNPPATSLMDQLGSDQEQSQARKEYFRSNVRQLAGQIKSRFTYPQAAREQGWSGKVLISFVLDLKGQVHDLRVEKTSGYALLDQSALHTVQRSSPFPLPARITKIILPITYQLE